MLIFFRMTATDQNSCRISTVVLLSVVFNFYCITKPRHHTHWLLLSHGGGEKKLFQYWQLSQLIVLVHRNHEQSMKSFIFVACQLPSGCLLSIISPFLLFSSSRYQYNVIGTESNNLNTYYFRRLSVFPCTSK